MRTAILLGTLALAVTGSASAAAAAPAHSATSAGVGRAVSTNAPATVRPEATVQPNINQVGCGSRTDWFRIWTQHHGYPACFANNGQYYIGNNPPVTTWTTYGICAGSNSGYVDYYVSSSSGKGWWRSWFKTGQCIDWSHKYGTVEVEGFGITGR
jgi:hypothetical protein